MTFTVDLIPQFPGAQPTEETVARAYAQPGTEVNQLPTRETGGHEVWTIKTSNADLKQLIAIVYHAGWVHRIKAAGLAADFETDEAQDFVDSVRIQPEDWEPPRDRIEINGDVWVYRDAEWAREVSPFSDDDSWIALAAAVGVALIAILYFILRRRSRPDVI